jgi:hypothetical protein
MHGDGQAMWPMDYAKQISKRPMIEWADQLALVPDHLRDMTRAHLKATVDRAKCQRKAKVAA